MLRLEKTKHSEFIRSVLVQGKGINLANNNCYILHQLLRQSHDPQLGKVVEAKWQHFEKFLKCHKLKITVFALGHAGDRYSYFYEVESRVHKNQPLRVDGQIEDPGVPFSFVPNLFADWLNQIIDAAPLAALNEVADGR
jgi:hypothetical protein